MNRRHALIIAILAALVFAVVYFWPETARADVTGRLHLGDGGAQAGVQLGDRPRWRRRHKDRHDWRRAVLVVPYRPAERVIIRETVVTQPSSPPASVAAPPEPLDPQGRARTLPARGLVRPREWVLGAALPPDLPHVVLDPAAYGLPQPPAGQLYARADGDVLRIGAGSRRIVAVVAR